MTEQTNRRIVFYTWMKIPFSHWLLSAVTSSMNTSDPILLAALHAHVSIMFNRLCGIISYHELFPIILAQMNLDFIGPKILFQSLAGSFRCRCKVYILVVLFLRVTTGLHFVVNPLYFHSWRILLIVDFYNNVNIHFSCTSKNTSPGHENACQSFVPLFVRIWNKAETLHFNHILIVSLKISCDGVRRQNYTNYIFDILTTTAFTQ